MVVVVGGRKKLVNKFCLSLSSNQHILIKVKVDQINSRVTPMHMV